MQTTSSPTSATPSSDYKAAPFIAWSILAALFIAFSFIGRAVSDEDTSDVFYDSGFAVTTIVYYAVLVGLTFLIGLGYRPTPPAIGLNPFRWKWVGIAAGLIVGVLIVGAALEPLLHGGREQGLSPDEWQPEHDSLRTDRVGKAADAVRVDVLPRLARVRPDRAERDLQELRGGSTASDENLQPAAEASSARRGRQARSLRGSRRPLRPRRGRRR